jgi:hypothetical protein
VLSRERARTHGNEGAPASPFPGAGERCQKGSNRRSCRQPKTLRRSILPGETRQKRMPMGPKPASRRQARGRWRPDDRKVVRRLSRRRPKALFEAGLEVERRRVSHGARRAVSRGGVEPWVLVTQDVGCRSGFEAFWRRDRGKAARPYEDATSSDGEGHRPGRGQWSFPSRQGCYGCAKVERPERAPRSRCPAITLARDRAQKSNPWKARGVSMSRTLNRSGNIAALAR